MSEIWSWIGSAPGIAYGGLFLLVICVLGLMVLIQRTSALRARYEMAASQNESKDQEILKLHQKLNEQNLEFLKVHTELTSARVHLDESVKREVEQKNLFLTAHNEIENRVQVLAAKTLEKNNESFLKLATERLNTKTNEALGIFDRKIVDFQSLVEPIRDVLGKVELNLSKVELERAEQFGRITEQLISVSQIGETLRKETNSLTSALRRPEVRGSWGEIQLRRVVELAGMSAYCDFEEQVTTKREGQALRPDLIVRLPNERVIVVDSKSVLDAFLDAVQSPTTDEKLEHLKRHARNLRQRVSELGRKSYWQQFENAPDFAVMFIPNEALLAAAVEVDRDLIEDALEEKIVIATPTTLVALLKAIAYGWQQETITQNARDVLASAKELHERLLPWLKNLSDLGSRLGSTVKVYNETVGSLERRVMPSVRRFKEMALPSSSDFEPVSVVEQQVRELSTGGEGKRSTTLDMNST